MLSPEKKQSVFWLILVAITLLFTETSAYLILKTTSRFYIDYWPIPAADLNANDRRSIEEFLIRDGKSYVKPDRVLGWTNRPSATSESGQYHSNSKGLRGRTEFAVTRTKGRLRISAFGDSFTHGDEVGDDDTWEQKLAGLDSRLEVLNFGVGGYGPDQAWLRYGQDGVRFDSDVVLLGFMSENINRVVNVFRAFYTPATGLPLAKPRFFMNEDAVRLEPNPLPELADYRKLLQNAPQLIPRLGSRDYWYHTMPHEGPLDWLASVRLLKTCRFWFSRTLSPFSIVGFNGVYHRHTEALDITQEVLANFYQSVQAHHSTPIILLFPSHRDILRLRSHGLKRYAPLIEYLEARHLSYIDLLDGFQLYAGKYEAGGVLSHYSVSENEVVAKYLYQELKRRNLLSATGVN